MAKLDNKNGELLFEDIKKMYDLIENIVDQIAMSDGCCKNFKISIAKDVVAQVEESTNMLSINYLDWFQGGQKPDMKKCKETEKSVREMYEVVADFVEHCDELPSMFPQELTDDECHAKDNILESEVLAKVGTSRGEIQQGGVWESLNEQIKRLPELEDLILAIRGCTIHMWRICHYFVSKKLEFVNNILNMIPMRRAAEMRQNQGVQPTGKSSFVEASRTMGGYSLSF